MLDLVEGGADWDEIVAQARAVEAAGATIINTGIGWHEARVPTITTAVPRGAFAGVTAKLRPHVALPLVATNRSEEHTSELQSLMRISYAVFCLNKKNINIIIYQNH